MLCLFPALEFEVHLVFGLVRAERVRKTLPNILHRQRRGMHEIIGVKTVVAEFVHEDFVRGEIRRGELFHRHEERSLGELVLVESVFDMTDRRDGEKPVFIGIAV